jgi:hypothetical protein
VLWVKLPPRAGSAGSDADAEAVAEDGVDGDHEYGAE